MSITRKRIAARLRAARQGAGLTQALVARALALHRPAISEIEAGRRAVSAEELRELSRLYGVPVATLLSGGGGPKGDPGPALPRPEEQPVMQRWIDHMVSVIVHQFDPDQIILFGSHARGTAGPDSDVDLLVVMDVDGPKRRKAAQIGAALHHIPLAKDILVTTPAEFAWRKEIVGTIERPAVTEGRVLYVRE